MATSIFWLGTSLPPLATGLVYQLLEVGSIYPQGRPGQPSATVIVRFVVCALDEATTDASSASVLDWPITLQRAGILIPGTFWKADGHMLPSSLTHQQQKREVVCGARKLKVKRLRSLFSAAQLPPCLQSCAPDGWYNILPTAQEHLLLPCFELARAFYYVSGSSLISFYLSRLAITRICWPVAFVRSAWGEVIAHYCIAAHSLQQHEVRLFAELLFNAQCRQTIQRAHSALAVSWARARNTTDNAPRLKLSFELGRDVAIAVQGIPFSMEGVAYFLVQSLRPAAHWFSFDTVVHHSLSKLPAFPPAATAQVESVSTVFPLVNHLTSLLTPKEHVIAVADKLEQAGLPSHAWQRAPTVIAGVTWATTSKRSDASEQYPTPSFVAEQLWEGSLTYSPQAKRDSLPSLARDFPSFYQLIAFLRPYNYIPTCLALNTAGQEGNLDCSFFPHGSRISEKTHLPSRLRRPIALVQLTKADAYYYLLRIQDTESVFLLYTYQLNALTESQLNELLSRISYSRSSYQLRPGLDPFFLLPDLPDDLCAIEGSQTREVDLPYWCLEQMQWRLDVYNAYYFIVGAAAKGARPLQKETEELAYREAKERVRVGYYQFESKQKGEHPTVMS